MTLFKENNLDEVKNRLLSAYRTDKNPDGFLVGKRKYYQQLDGTPK